MSLPAPPAGTPLYRWFYNELRTAILDGRIAPGARLPATRDLAREYKLVSQPTDGRSLGSTPDGSCDLVQAFKVFSSVPFRATIRYWPEMVRVTRPGGFIVFDVMTEDCLPLETVEKWISFVKDNEDNGAFPAAFPKSAMLNYFSSAGCRLVGDFLGPMGVGATQTFVFQKVE